MHRARQGICSACCCERLTLSSDCFVTPTIFDDVSLDSIIAREEIFGPVLSVLPFDSEEQAVAIANDAPYGLAASVWTSHLLRALRVSRAIKVGTVSVNTVDAFWCRNALRRVRRIRVRVWSVSSRPRQVHGPQDDMDQVLNSSADYGPAFSPFNIVCRPVLRCHSPPLEL